MSPLLPAPANAMIIDDSAFARTFQCKTAWMTLNALPGPCNARPWMTTALPGPSNATAMDDFCIARTSNAQAINDSALAGIVCDI
ncbi:unnamed protein product, partial [Trichogramma brassicae]